MITKIKKIIKPLLLATGLIILLTPSIGATCGAPDYNANDCLENGKPGQVMKLLEIGINVLAVAVGVIAVINIIIGGIQYTTSNGDPQKVSDARKRIYNTFYGLAAFAFLYAFMEWLIPGGIF